MAPSPKPGAGGGSMLSSMMGDSSDQSQSPSPTPDQGSSQDPKAGIGAVIAKIRGMEQDLEGLASQFPNAAKQVRDATTAIRGILRAVVANPGSGEPQGPAING